MLRQRDQTALNIRERAGGRNQKPGPEREDGHLRTMGVAVSQVGVSSLPNLAHDPQLVGRSPEERSTTVTLDGEGGCQRAAFPSNPRGRTPSAPG